MGPASMADIRTLLLEDRLTGENLIWADGMMEWTPLANISDFDNIARAVPPALPQRSASDQLISLPESGSWRRFFARTIDLSIFYIIIIFTTAIVSDYLFGITPQTLVVRCAIGVFLTAVVLILDAAIFGVFGTTIGKFLLAVNVITVDGRQPTAAQYLKRQVGVYWYGHAAGFPILGYFAMIYQFRRLKSGKKTSYDDGKFHVKTPIRGPIRFVGVFIGIFIYSMFLSMIYMKINPNINTPDIAPIKAAIGVE